MTKEQALNIVSQAVAQVRATIAEHQQIQQALGVLSQEEPKEEEKSEE